MKIGSKPIVSFTVWGRPQQRGSKRPVRRGNAGTILLVDDNPNSKEWMGRVADAAAQAYQGDLIAGPVGLSVCYRFQRPKCHFGTGRNASRVKDSAPEHCVRTPDLSKLTRAIEDALTGIVWKDDRQVCEYMAPHGRMWTTEQECAVVSVYELEQG